MTNPKKMHHDPPPMGTVAVAGTDGWIRTAIASRLRRSGLSVRDFGPGTSSLRQAGTLVLVPRLVPRSGNPIRDVGLSANSMTLAAAIASGVDDVVLVSLVGADESQTGHLGALGTVESATHARARRLTIVRATQTYGTAGDLGPLVDRLRGALDRDPGALGELRCNPVFVGDVVDAVEAAVYRRITAGCVETAGQNARTVRDLISSLDRTTDSQHSYDRRESRSSRWPWARRVDRALRELFEAQAGVAADKGSVVRPVLHLDDPLRPPEHVTDQVQAA